MTGYPPLIDSSASYQGLGADLPLVRVFRQGQPWKIRLTATSNCFTWPDVPTCVEGHGVGPFLGLVLLSECSDLAESIGYLLESVRIDRGTLSPPILPAPWPYPLNACVVLPDHDSQTDVGTQRQMKEVLAMTGWSQRTAATILRTTHVTVGKLAAEGSSARSIDVAERLAAVHACIRRLAPIAADSSALRAALESPVDEEGTSAVKLLIAGEYARAYRFALQLLSPAPQTPLLRSRSNVSRLPATVPVDGASGR